MDFQTIYLSRKEMRRFLEIANGDTTAKNEPEEDALFRKHLVRECLLATADLSAGETSADYRAVVLSDLGKEYYAQYMSQQKKNKQEDFRYWLGVILNVLGIAATIAGVVVTIWLSIGDIC